MVCSRAGDKTGVWIQKTGGKDKQLQLAFLPLWLEWPVGPGVWLELGVRVRAMIALLILRSKSIWCPQLWKSGL